MIGLPPAAEQLIALLSEREVAVQAFAEEDWQRIVEFAQRQSVAPMLYARLKAREITPTPNSAQQLQEIYYAGISRNAFLFHELGKILRALLAAEIPVIPLKGVCLAEVVYVSLALRQMADVDLLVRPADLAKAVDVLLTLGYASAEPFDIRAERRFHHEMPPLSNHGACSVELHWTIATPRCNVHLTENDLEQLWLRATPAKISNVHVLILSPTDLLLHLCLHASVHHRFIGIGLRDFWDIARVVDHYGDQINWERFIRLVNQLGIANGTFLVLKLTEEYTDILLPMQVMRALMPTKLDAATIEWVNHKIWYETSPELQGTDVARLGKARTADKLAALRDSLFPSRQVMAYQYPAPADSWRILSYYPVRFKDLWMRYGRLVWRLVTREKTLTNEARQEARLREYLGWN